ncbi:hypothetical protein [Peijinzhouia sedimentorum]
MKFFKRHIIPKKSFFRRFFNLPDKEQFLPDLSNLLASLDLEEVRMEDVDELFLKYKIDPARDLINEREDMYFDYLIYSIKKEVDIVEIARDKQILLTILKLEIWQAIKIHKKLAQSIEGHSEILANLTKQISIEQK